MVLTDLENKANEIRSELSQVEARIAQEKSYLDLNDLYLDIQRGDIRLTRKVYDKLYALLWGFEKYGSSMFNWWESEFRRLPGWLNV
jgi:hypothetical protein